ncbi:MAG TPA: hypothetical protein VGE21_13395 [Flavobacteriales bacterium]
MLRRFHRSLIRFEHWFDRHLGWFFTNGMKTDRHPLGRSWS